MKTIHVVSAVIRRENEVFATQKGYGEWKGWWEFPGGKVEDGETSKEALFREIQEELETSIEVGDLIEVVEHDYPKFHLYMECFWATVLEGNLVLKEAQNSMWLKQDELHHVKWLPGDLGLIETIKKELIKSEQKEAEMNLSQERN